MRRLAFEFTFAILTFLRALFRARSDVVVVSYPPAVMPIFGLIAGKLRRSPVIFEMRDLMADGLEATGYIRSRTFVRIAKLVERTVIRFSDHIISVSPGLKKILVARGVPDDKISVVTNGYEPEVFDAGVGFDARREFEWGDSFVAIYAGGLTQAYDIPTMLRAAERLRDESGILFVMVGEGDRKLEYQDFCRERGLQNCRFVGYQARKKMPAILSAANVGLHMFRDQPLWTYVLGNKVFDYFGSGLPVVYAGAGDTADLVKAAGGGFVVTPESDAQLAEKVLYLKNHPDQARALGERGREYVQTHYNRRDLLRDFEEVLSWVASRRK